MSDTFFSSHTHHQDDEHDAPEEGYRIPLGPKVALILNINAAIWAAAVTVIVTVTRRENNIEQIASLSNLILCFLVGVVIAMLSCGCDRAARNMYRREAAQKKAWFGVAEICDISAVGALAAAFAIFAWGVWSIVMLAAMAYR
ncbi:hypothetical protein LG047_17165 [Methylocystis sp. WRRC1]|uniref:hypothetical protein n=1 Tax=Methylocystis sp. WRRC1 TaxID=1732014 RepID=UPI001D152EA9|nr:hypothetical protein [Methylocystis sp. WRRC1]MCC3247027.1 hypothetical protein [Methylocystis sp. WRRC1]